MTARIDGVRIESSTPVQRKHNGNNDEIKIDISIDYDSVVQEFNRFSDDSHKYNVFSYYVLIKSEEGQRYKNSIRD